MWQEDGKYKYNIRFIRKNTANMTMRETVEYILAYYWYHILGIVATVALIVFLIVHFGFGEDAPEFTCVFVNQVINYSRDEELAEDFASYAGLSEKLTIMDSDYQISYGDVELEGINESSYEKFFFKWNNDELDAVVMPISFYEYCKEMGGEFINLSDMETGELDLYVDDGKYTGVYVDDTGLTDYFIGGIEEELLLVFPSNGQHLDACQQFLNYVEEG